MALCEDRQTPGFWPPRLHDFEKCVCCPGQFVYHGSLTASKVHSLFRFFQIQKGPLKRNQCLCPLDVRREGDLLFLFNWQSQNLHLAVLILLQKQLSCCEWISIPCPGFVIIGCTSRPSPILSFTKIIIYQSVTELPVWVVGGRQVREGKGEESWPFRQSVSTCIAWGHPPESDSGVTQTEHALQSCSLGTWFLLGFLFASLTHRSISLH